MFAIYCNGERLGSIHASTPVVALTAYLVRRGFGHFATPALSGFGRVAEARIDGLIFRSELVRAPDPLSSVAV
jgi:hypothetical protein